jgi:hypothetical protein
LDRKGSQVVFFNVFFYTGVRVTYFFAWWFLQWRFTLW